MDKNTDIKNTLKTVYRSLEKDGYNAKSQMVGYLTTGEPAYISDVDKARVKIQKFHREDYIEALIVEVLEIKE